MNTQANKHVLFEELPAKRNKIGKVILNRPEALNALSPEMIIELDHKLRIWAHDPNISAVIITSASEKAFCAGGDIKHLYTIGAQAYIEAMPFFRYEYKLDGFISTYPKPYISLINNIAMGGGLGISVNGSVVIAASNLKLAMPETGIGLYPDTGATHFLSKCPHNLGMYLGLTGRIIDVADAMYCGLVDYHIPEDKFAQLIEGLCAYEVADYKNLFQKFTIDPGPSKLAQHINTIKQCFAHNSVAEIIRDLDSRNDPWSRECATHLLTRSPSSLMITHKAFNMAKNMTLHEALAMEFNLTLKIIQTHDFYEGVRAVLIDKDKKPKWSPATLSAVTKQKIDQFFDMHWQL